MNPRTLIVLGAGPGGYAAALEAARHGWTVTLIDKDQTGGTCLNRGCIPSKFFLSRAHDANASAYAIDALMARKNAILDTLRQRMDQAAKSARITRVKGAARFVSPRAVDVEGQRLEADTFVIATGTTPIHPAFFPTHPAIVDSTGLLQIDRIPKHLVVVGGGYIGCELASAFRGLGSAVTLIEKESALLATQSEFEPAAGVLSRAFQKRGITVWTGVEVKSVTPLDANTVSMACSNGETLTADTVLLALGRRADLSALGLDAAGINVTGGRIVVNQTLQTSLPYIYALGDIVSPLPLAHTATREAEVVIAHLMGESKTIDYAAIPRCIYTTPEIAAVGRVTKERAIRYHMAANAKALVEEQSDGFWLVSSDPATKKIEGALIVGAHATELIHLVAISMKAGLTTTDIAETVFAHPTLAESFGEAMKRVSST